MALEVYYPDDIRNALRAAEQATQAALPDNKLLTKSTSSEVESDYAGYWYKRGYLAALKTIALAFGLIENTRSIDADRPDGV